VCARAGGSHHRWETGKGIGAGDQTIDLIRAEPGDRKTHLADRGTAGTEGRHARRWYSPTQPIPTKPPFFGRNGFTADDLIDFTPELRAEALKIASKYKWGPVFTPPVVSKPEGPMGTLILGYPNGGANWAGGSYDPETHTFYVFSQSTIGSDGLVPPDPGESDMRYVVGFPKVDGLDDTRYSGPYWG